MYFLIPVLLLALLVIYFIGRSYGKGKAKVADDTALDNDIVKTELSYPLSSFASFADILHNAMLGVGTDFTSIKNVFSKINNKSDLFQLIKSFGTRGSYIDYGIYNALVFSGNLSYWLNDELSESEKDELILMLKNKNIIFTF